ncbi:hypothetical protein LR48_Vigan205s006700 [Vigna angularis]|uniref:Uncharacterized protein n=1 Tax=Phaseolus angularis TaxID=3914 RepID=A0A0L9T5Q3_PHAAN|nr:hypothetical protein LR48_Vigan205s006700 [Vigna angularis]
MGNPNPLPQRNASSSGVSPSRELSFKNYNKEGNQNFKDSQIKSDSCSCVLRRNKSGKVVFNGGAGQIFENSIINGVKVKSETTSSSESKTTGEKCKASLASALRCLESVESMIERLNSSDSPKKDVQSSIMDNNSLVNNEVTLEELGNVGKGSVELGKVGGEC